MSRPVLSVVGIRPGQVPEAVRARAVRVGLAVSMTLVSLEAGRFVAGGSVRNLSLILGLVVAGALAQLEPRGVLAVTLALTPLPLYVHGLHVSLLVPLVAGVWLSVLARSTATANVVHSLALRGYGLPLLAVAATSLIALWRGSSDRTGADLGALGRLAVGMALFAACLFVIRSSRELRLALVALGASAGIVLALTALQLAAPSLHIPGLLSTDAGTVQQNLYGIASNLRVTGPLGDYELLAEFFALAGSMGAYLGLRSSGRARLAWLSLVPASLAGIAATSTRSGLVVLVVGCALSVFGRRAAGRRLQLIPLAACIWLLGLPLLHALQARAGTGFLFNRSIALPTGSGLSGFLDRGHVWPFFLDRLPHGVDLLFGRSLAFDYGTYGTYPHSLPLTLVFTVGIAGAVAFYWLLVTVFWRCVQGLRSRAPYAGLGALLVFLFVVDQVKIEYLRVFNYQWFVWGLLGVCAATARIGESDGRGAEVTG